MWKWTNSNNIKVIILDADSLNSDFLSFPYNQYVLDVQIFLVKHINNLIQFHTQEVITYFDVTVLLQNILAISKCDSTSIISISNNPLFLKEMMQNHIGTILTSDLKKDFLKNTPDFTNCTIDLLPMILNEYRVGYGAEVYATYGEARLSMSLLKCESTITLENGTTKNIDFYFGGRYYAEKYQYLFNDPLSFVVLGFKNQYMSSVDLFFDSAIKFIRKRVNADILTYIPLKPQDLIDGKFDRFASLILERNKKDGFELQNILEFNKNFSQKGNDLFMRKETVKNSLKVLVDVHDKNIIIIDDVYSSGSTISEAIKTLYENGAKKVTAILLSVNQMTESILEYQDLHCPICGNQMVLRVNKANGQLFFGCKDYLSHSKQSYTLNIEEGLNLLKKENKLSIDDIIDLDDEY